LLQNKSNTPLNIAILGANGIGRVHARIFHSLGIKIKAITCSSKNSASQAEKFLLDSYGIRTKAFSNINDAIAEPMDAVSICTPPHLHYEHILAAFNKRLPVFCEKPLFWDPSCNMQNVKSRLEILQNHPHRQLFVNTSNTVLLHAIGNQLPKPNSVNEFSFIFHTQGPFNYQNIAIDLLPHGFSILLKYFGEKKIKSFNAKATLNNFYCNFLYGHCKVKFDFQEKPNGIKRLAFGFNDDLFERRQEGIDITYKVYMQELKSGNRFYSDDPFKTYIEKFIKYCHKNKLERKDNFMEASKNLELVAYCLDRINQQKN
jgi:hypothetical protein